MKMNILEIRISLAQPYYSHVGPFGLFRVKMECSDDNIYLQNKIENAIVDTLIKHHQASDLYIKKIHHAWFDETDKEKMREEIYKNNMEDPVGEILDKIIELKELSK